MHYFNDVCDCWCGGIFCMLFSYELVLTGGRNVSWDAATLNPEGTVANTELLTCQNDGYVSARSQHRK